MRQDSRSEALGQWDRDLLQMSRMHERRAELLAETLRRAGEPEAEVQRRVQRALDRARDRRAKREPAVNRFAGCMSITDAARELGMRRSDLFAWLERSVWLRCTRDGWQATDGALAAGWAVMRGARAVRWVQLTPAGLQEINRRLAAARGGADD